MRQKQFRHHRHQKNRTDHFIFPAFFVAVIAFGTVACVGKKVREFDPSKCNEHAGFQAGYNDGDEGRPVATEFLQRCRPDLRKQAQQGYRDGYAQGKSEYSARMAEYEKHQHEIRLRDQEANLLAKAIKESGIQTTKEGYLPPEKQWFCFVSSERQSFYGFGYTRLEAKNGAARKCSKNGARKSLQGSCSRVTCSSRSAAVQF